MSYNPFNWYWAVAGDTGHVFSSATGTVIATGNSTYQSWLGPEQAPTSIMSYSSLYDVLTIQAPSVAQQVTTSWATSGYLTPAQAYNGYITLGVSVAVSGHPEVNGVYPIGSIAIIGYNVVQANLINGSLSVPVSFPDVSGVPRTFTASGTFITFNSHIASYFQTLQSLAAGASGAWPSPSVSY
jgi:hypothetical protein